MTYDPYRQPSPQDPYENPYRVNDVRNVKSSAGTSTALLLGALLLAAIGAFVYFGSGERTTVANNEIRVPITQPNDPARNDPARNDAARPAAPETTGSGASNIEPGERPAGAQ